uniref:Uncharacterized protein n=1 Tax=viral metagenome TaxID=1070528 RepID=A0A6C0D7J6_9ZZZZ
MSDQFEQYRKLLLREVFSPWLTGNKFNRENGIYKNSPIPYQQTEIYHLLNVSGGVFLGACEDIINIVEKAVLQMSKEYPNTILSNELSLKENFDIEVREYRINLDELSKEGQLKGPPYEMWEVWKDLIYPLVYGSIYSPYYEIIKKNERIQEINSIIDIIYTNLKKFLNISDLETDSILMYLQEKYNIFNNDDLNEYNRVFSKNKLLALKMINKYSNENGIRFEDTIELLHETFFTI